jgi:hypothetical protein
VPRPALALLIATLALAGCGNSNESGHTPDPCLSGPVYYKAALKKAPDRVRLPGNTPISGCLVSDQTAGDLGNVGNYMVKVATGLNATARRDTAGAATVQLGYLVGAATRGASETSGIHDELIRRLEAAALYSPAGKPPPQPFDHQYKTGYAAGRENG